MYSLTAVNGALIMAVLLAQKNLVGAAPALELAKRSTGENGTVQLVFIDSDAAPNKFWLIGSSHDCWQKVNIAATGGDGATHVLGDACTFQWADQTAGYTYDWAPLAGGSTIGSISCPTLGGRPEVVIDCIRYLGRIQVTPVIPVNDAMTCPTPQGLGESVAKVAQCAWKQY